MEILTKTLNYYNMKKGRKANFPDGKKKKILISINQDYEKETKELINPILSKFHLLPNETESEYIKRIQDMHFENTTNGIIGKK